MSEHKTTGWEVLALFLLIPFEAAWSGFVLTRLWAWFIVTTFGLAPLRIAQALGISLTVHFLTSSTSDAKEKRGTGEAIALSIMISLMVLFFGWTYHLFL